MSVMKHAVCSVAGMTMIRVEIKDLLSVPKSDWHEALKNDELSSQIRRGLEMNKQPLLDIMKDDIDRIVDENVKQVKKEADERLWREKEETDDRLRRN